MKAIDIMTRPAIAVSADETVAKAAALMLDNRISGLPVVDAAGNLVGMVTEGDFLRRTETGTERRRPRWLEILLGPGRLAQDYVLSHARVIREVMTRDVATVAEDTPVEEIVRLMERRRIKRVPVVKDGKITGIVSRANLLRALASIVAIAPEPSADDRALRRRIEAEIDKQKWSPRIGVDVTVQNGVVDLWGVILNENERSALRVAAENTPGVKAVRDHLTWVEPVSGLVIEAPGEDAA